MQCAELVGHIVVLAAGHPDNRKSAKIVAVYHDAEEGIRFLVQPVEYRETRHNHVAVLATEDRLDVWSATRCILRGPAR